MKRGRFTGSLWSGVEEIYQSILSHGFLRGLTDGSLPRACFRFYVIQDSHYLREFARALSLAAAKAPEDDWILAFNRHAAEALEVERRLHDSFFRDFGLSREAVRRAPVAPTNLAYTSYLLAVAYSRPFAEVLGAVLPCYWVYAEVGRALKEKGSPERLYQRWIDTYGGEEFAAVVAAVIDITDGIAERESESVKEAMACHFLTTTRYEWMFWDMGLRREEWPV